jgi:hypothetical protein
MIGSLEIIGSSSMTTSAGCLASARPDEEVWGFVGFSIERLGNCLEDLGSVFAVDDPRRVGVWVMNLEG